MLCGVSVIDELTLCPRLFPCWSVPGYYFQKVHKPFLHSVRVFSNIASQLEGHWFDFQFGSSFVCFSCSKQAILQLHWFPPPILKHACQVRCRLHLPLGNVCACLVCQISNMFKHLYNNRDLCSWVFKKNTLSRALFEKKSLSKDMIYVSDIT